MSELPLFHLHKRIGHFDNGFTLHRAQCRLVALKNSELFIAHTDVITGR